MKTFAVVLAVIVCAMTLPMTGALDAPEMDERQEGTRVDLATESPGYTVGETVVLDVGIRGADNVGSVRFHLRFNPELLRFKAPAVEGPFMQDGGAITMFLASEAEGGDDLTLGIARQGTDPGASGSGSLAKLSFEAIGAGVVRFEFESAGVRDPDGGELPATFHPAHLKITAKPQE